MVPDFTSVTHFAAWNMTYLVRLSWPNKENKETTSENYTRPRITENADLTILSIFNFQTNVKKEEKF